MKLSELAGTKPPHILMYGEVGCGKTALALTLGARAQVADIDDGLKTGLTLDDALKPERLKVDVRQFKEPMPHKQATLFAQFKTYVLGVANDINAKKFPFDALIIDSFSALAEAAVAATMYNCGRLGQTPEIQHWGIAFSEIKNVLSVVRSMPIVVVLIAHEQTKTVGSGATKEDKLEIAVQGKNLPSQVCRYYDEIWYVRARPVGAGKLQYVLQTKSDGAIAARSRGNLPNLFDTSVGLWPIIEKLGYVPPARSTTT